MNNNCDCYRIESKRNTTVGVCWGTKEMDECSCGGDKSKCDFYPDIRSKAAKAEKKIYLYAARDTSTGKLVSDITNPKRKYWDKRGNAQSAIDYYNSSYANKKLPYSSNKGEHGLLELVKFELVEVPVDVYKQ